MLQSMGLQRLSSRTPPPQKYGISLAGSDPGETVPENNQAAVPGFGELNFNKAET